jgi:hypothetical protein
MGRRELADKALLGVMVLLLLVMVAVVVALVLWGLRVQAQQTPLAQAALVLT